MADAEEALMFIQDDDYTLLMEDQEGYSYSLDDLLRFRDAGVKTVIRTPFWRNLEPRQGEYDWSSVDYKVAITRKAGLKCMLGVYDHAPAFFPDDWYLKKPDGSRYSGGFYENVISPWSVDGFAAHLEFMNKCCYQYSFDDVLCYRATVHGGEVMMPEFEPYRMDTNDFDSSMIRVMLEEQSVFYNSHPSRELWTCLHHAFDYLPYSGTALASRLYGAMRDAFPKHKHYSISYTQFAPNVAGEVENLASLHNDGLAMFAGSEYAEGLIANTDAAIAQGFRGFVTAPMHAMSGHKTLEPWMLAAFSDSIKKWSAHAQQH